MGDANASVRAHPVREVIRALLRDICQAGAAPLDADRLGRWYAELMALDGQMKATCASELVVAAGEMSGRCGQPADEAVAVLLALAGRLVASIGETRSAVLAGGRLSAKAARFLGLRGQPAEPFEPAAAPVKRVWEIPLASRPLKPR